jgi:hypothetical protein
MTGTKSRLEGLCQIVGECSTQISMIYVLVRNRKGEMLACLPRLVSAKKLGRLRHRQMALSGWRFYRYDGSSCWGME